MFRLPAAGWQNNTSDSMTSGCLIFCSMEKENGKLLATRVFRHRSSVHKIRCMDQAGSKDDVDGGDATEFGDENEAAE